MIIIFGIVVSLLMACIVGTSMWYNYHPEQLMSLPPQTLMISSGLISVFCLILYFIETRHTSKGDDPLLEGQMIPGMGYLSLVGFIGFGVLFLIELVKYLLVRVP